jgi:two-component system cell cycle sensor histidine kinase/response regulator CckA
MKIECPPSVRSGGPENLARSLRSASTSLPVGEERGRASEGLYGAIFDSAMDAMLVADVAGNYVDANPAACALFGCTRGELVGKQLKDFIATEEGAPEAQMFVSGARLSGEFSLHRLDGLRRDVEYRAVADVLPGLHLSVFRDVTARKSAEGALREADERLLRTSEARFRAMIEKSHDGITLIDATGTILYVSPAITKLAGRSSSELTGGSTFDFVHPDDRGRMNEVFAAVMARPSTPVNCAFRAVHADGTIRWMEATGTNLLSDPAVGAIVSNFRDITERKLVEQELHASELRYRRIVENTSEGVWMYDASGTTTFMSPRMAEMLGYSVEETIGKSILAFIHEDAHEEGVLRIARRMTGIKERGDFRLKRRDGSELWVAINADALFDPTGAFESALALVTDITGRRQSEAAIRRTEEQLRQAQKMEAIGILAGGVAHDFNNLLSVILSYASLLMDDLPAADPMRADLAEVKKAGLRAAELTAQLLAFSRQQVLQPVVLDLGEVAARAEKMLRRLLGEDIDFSLLTSPAVGKVLADDGQMAQVLMNLVVNARDAMPNGGSLTLETTNIEVDESYAATHAGLTPGRYVLLAVTDSGTGMDAATQARIFEPFFTTKDKSKGTGLGLSTVYGIVKQSGGHIWLYSELGKGTTFKVYLPRTDRLLEPGPPIPVSSTLRGTETILVAEDEEQVRAIMCAILRKQGYRVLEGQSGGDAFLLCEQFSGEIHLLITDVVMPRMSGRQLAERLSKVRPEMKVLYVSGYTDDAIVRHGVLEAGVAFLSKPIMPEQLSKKVRRVLDARSSAPGEVPAPPATI